MAAIDYGVSPRSVPGASVGSAGRWTSIAGLVYVGAWIAGLIIGFSAAAPSPTASPTAVSTFFSSHRELAMIQAYLQDGLAGIALIVFAAGLRGVFGAGDRKKGTAATVLFGAGVAAGTISLLQGLFTQVLTDHVAAMGNPAVVRALYDLSTEGNTYKLLAIGVLLGAAALAILRTGLFTRWLAWSGAILGALLIVAGWNFVLSTSAQYTAYSILLIPQLLWFAIVSVVAMRLGRE